jgi:hypothetical protein
VARFANRKDRFMTTQERAMEVAKLRLRFQMNGRLRLESLAALSKVFREYGEPIREELLGSIVFAVPEELLGPADPNLHAQLSDTGKLSNAPATPGKPPAFPDAPATPGGKPPTGGGGAPATPGPGGKPPTGGGGAPATPGGKPPSGGGGAPATPGNPPARPKGNR